MHTEAFKTDLPLFRIQQKHSVNISSNQKGKRISEALLEACLVSKIILFQRLI